MTITGQSSLSSDEIERMVSDAEAHADEDRRRKEEAETRNAADSLVYQTEKLLREQGAQVSGEDKDKVEAGLADLKKALDGGSLEDIKAATDALVGASQGFAQRLYEQSVQERAEAAAAQQGAAASAAADAAADDEVVDAEIVDDER